MIGSNATVSVQRMQKVDGIETPAAYLSGLDCYVEQLSPDKAQAIDGNALFRVYRFIFDDVLDIQESDQLTDQEGRKYKVRGVQHFDGNSDIDSHSEITALRNNAKVTA